MTTGTPYGSTLVAIPTEETKADQVAAVIFPEAQARVTKYFGTTRVDWCSGESDSRWMDSYVHWLEIHLSPTEIIRENMSNYDSPAHLTFGNASFVGFTGYYEGDMPIEQPLSVQTGNDS